MITFLLISITILAILVVESIKKSLKKKREEKILKQVDNLFVPGTIFIKTDFFGEFFKDFTSYNYIIIDRIEDHILIKLNGNEYSSKREYSIKNIIDYSDKLEILDNTGKIIKTITKDDKDRWVIS